MFPESLQASGRLCVLSPWQEDTRVSQGCRSFSQAWSSFSLRNHDSIYGRGPTEPSARGCSPRPLAASVLPFSAVWPSASYLSSLVPGFIVFVVVVLGLHCFAGAFSRCGEAELLSVGRVQASPYGDFSLQSTALRHVGSAVAVYKLSRSAVGGIFPDQGPNSCRLHWKVDSYPLYHQGSPRYCI